MSVPAYFKAGMSLLVLFIMALTCGCTKDQSTHITNSYGPQSAIIGRAYARHTPVTVSAWQATEIVRVVADDSGYFALPNIPVGVYRVELRSAADQVISVAAVDVEAGETVDLGNRYVDYFNLRLDRRTNLNAVPPGFRGELFDVWASVPLDFTSMGSCVSWSPTAPLTLGYDSYYQDRFSVYVLDDLKPATAYTVRIDPTLRSVDGIELDAHYSILFQTDSVRFSGLLLRSGQSYYDEWVSDTIVPPSYVPAMRLVFNMPVDIDSLNKAFSITPAIPGFWLKTLSSNYPYDTVIQYFPTAYAPIPPEQVYTLTINGGVPIFSGGYTLGHTVTKHIVTEPVRAVYVSPSPGSTLSYNPYYVEVQFNTPMDTASVNAAFSLTKWDGTPVPRSWQYWSSGNTHAEWEATFVNGTAYKLSIATSAKSVDGYHLRDSVYSYFAITP